MPYQINDSVFYGYIHEGEGYWSAATITALGTGSPQPADLHVTPIAPIEAFDVTNKLHTQILAPNRWCTPDELNAAEPGGCGSGLR